MQGQLCVSEVEMRRRLVSVLLGATLMAASLGACSGPSGQPNPSEQPKTGENIVMAAVDYAPGQVKDTDLTAATAAMNDLGFKMLSHKGSGNAVASPFSVGLVLAQLSLGAKGDSLAQLDAALGQAPLADRYSALQASLDQFDGDPAVVGASKLPEKPLLHIANNVVVDKGLQLDEQFLQDTKRLFDTGVMQADLQDASSKALLDAWVKKESGGLIEKSGINPAPGLLLVLQNAVTFAALWQNPFSADNTAPGEFTTAGGEKVSTDMMFNIGRYAYVKADGVQVVRLNYNDELVADFLLPAPGIDPAKAVTAEQLAAIQKTLGDEKSFVDVDLGMPKVKIKATHDDLIELMSAEFGITDIFNGEKADLAGLVKDKNLFADQFIQQAVLEINEDGTKAAAVTEMGLKESSALLPEDILKLRFDHPYLVVISHVPTGNPLFMAQVMNPAE